LLNHLSKNEYWTYLVAQGVRRCFGRKAQLVQKYLLLSKPAHPMVRDIVWAIMGQAEAVGLFALEMLVSSIG